MKKSFIILLLCCFFTGMSLAEVATTKEAHEQKKAYREISSIAKMGGIPKSGNYLTSQSGLFFQGSDTKITFGSKTGFAFSLGTTYMTNDWSESDFPILGRGGYTKSESLFINGGYLELSKVWGKWLAEPPPAESPSYYPLSSAVYPKPNIVDIIFNTLVQGITNAIINPSKSEALASIRLDLLSAHKKRVYTGSISLNEELRGQGLKLSVCIGAKAPLKISDNIIIGFSLSPDFYYLPLTGTLNNAPSRQEISGLLYGFDFGLGLRF